ncbi:secondary thiamine-phosphate synthase enzyme YjbQ [Cognatishimia sp. F0-27]|uniref:secondary thiamine-phosphate synthase enzyme YjbQ n=1 Tax=Cognatishimia sp. F0-27 TaxID=2816855 RepID=UPI001D0BFD92|nr:secondary thiamine-phosphate synthase enzyme YjbQ [Cognatishimia sp. F0-27]MCC1491733.1 YjbQ family protein [Cognatishimia sp. F0-27]
MQTRFEVETRGVGFYDMTDTIRAWVAAENPDIGLLTLFIQHTSASLLIQENADADVQTDLLAYLDRLVPPSSHPSMAYLRHTYEGPDDMPAHIKAAFLPTSLSIPVSDGRLALGTWQGIFLVEHRTNPHRRHVRAHLA